MKAVMFQNGLIKYAEVQMATLKAQWARVKVAVAGLCGTDVIKLSAGNLSPSHTTILGHEFSGTVIEVNGTDNRISSGDQVVVMPLIFCGECEACKNGITNLCAKGQALGRTIRGAFAEYVDAPLTNLVLLPASSTLEPYVLTDPLAVCLHACGFSSAFPSVKDCLVIGDGTIGCMLSWTLLQQGHNVWLKGVHQESLQFAEALGSRILTSESPPGSFDVIYETVGRSQPNTLSQAIQMCKPGGLVVVLGVFNVGYTYPLVARDLFIKEVRLVGSNAYTPDEFSAAVNMIGANQGVMSMFISHRYPLSRFSDALTTARQKSEFTMKIILRPGE